MLHMAFGIVGVSILCFMLSGPEVLNFHSLFFLRFAGRYEQTCDAYEMETTDRDRSNENSGIQDTYSTKLTCTSSITADLAFANDNAVQRRRQITEPQSITEIKSV